MVIKALALCAALLAPKSTGEDPHGRALHLKLYDDYDTSYEACIHTAKMAKAIGIDPFMTTALVYEATGFAVKRTRNKRHIRKLAKMYGCAGLENTPRTSCSAITLSIFHFSDVLRRANDYFEAVCGFFEENGTCYRENEQKTTRTLNLARRFVYAYNRSHSSTVLNWAFKGMQPRKRHASRPAAPKPHFEHLHPSESEDVVFFEMGDPMKQLKFLTILLGQGMEVSHHANPGENNRRDSVFLIDVSSGELRNRLNQITNGQNRHYHNRYRAGRLESLSQTDFRLYFHSNSKNFSLKFIKVNQPPASAPNLRGTYQVYVE